ncbi:hypothetical protein FB451DRAFT_1401664 [Mycena latifolia]|nr:hypothetical protein FB451DRAFT_1401664 [Mycena latifolia]
MSPQSSAHTSIPVRAPSSRSLDGSALCVLSSCMPRPSNAHVPIRVHTVLSYGVQTRISFESYIARAHVHDRDVSFLALPHARYGGTRAYGYTPRRVLTSLQRTARSFAAAKLPRTQVSSGGLYVARTTRVSRTSRIFCVQRAYAHPSAIVSVRLHRGTVLCCRHAPSPPSGDDIPLPFRARPCISRRRITNTAPPAPVCGPRLPHSRASLTHAKIAASTASLLRCAYTRAWVLTPHRLGTPRARYKQLEESADRSRTARASPDTASSRSARSPPPPNTLLCGVALLALHMLGLGQPPSGAFSSKTAL